MLRIVFIWWLAGGVLNASTSGFLGALPVPRPFSSMPTCGTGRGFIDLEDPMWEVRVQLVRVDSFVDVAATEVIPISVGIRYPRQLLRAGLNADLGVHVAVSRDGLPLEVYVRPSQYREFEEAVLAGFFRSRFKPADLDGHRVMCEMEYSVKFTVDE